ncbi:UNVERIFIED_CONTAM: hypothetical protein FKN15_065145 [Acipenser sinensis]
MEGWSWRDGFQDLEDLLGGLEDQGWCLACGVYGHTVAVCPFQSEEEEERSEERGRMRGERRKSCRRQQKQWQQLPPRVVVVDEWCPGCGEFGHTVAICPTQYQREEWMTQMVDWVYQEREGRERKVRRRQRGNMDLEWEEPERPAPKRGESVRQQPKKGKAEGPQPRYLPAEGEFLLVTPPPPWEDDVSLPPPPAEGEYLLLPPPWED